MSNNDSRKKMHNQPKIFVAKPLKFNIKRLDKKFYRADLEFHGVDHSGPSYEGRVFINNPKANDKTTKTLKNGYVGSFYIFGHGRCFGDIGHCDVTKERLPFDYRPSHPLTPAFKRIKITDQITRIGNRSDEFIITIVPVLAGGSEIIDENVVKLEKISIVTYNN